MTQIANNPKKQAFELIRKQYPQKLIDIHAKSALLLVWIQKSCLDDFRQMYRVEITHGHIQNQKVLDQSNTTPQNIQIDQKVFDKELLEAIKIIVQAYEKNQSIREKYQFDHVIEIVEKTKLTLKQLLKIQQKQQTNYKTQPSNTSQTKNISQQKVHPSKQTKKQTQPANQQPNNQRPSIPVQPVSKPANQQPNNQRPSIPVQPVSKPANQQPKTNSLFVQKQAPISEENIFKGQNFRRPSSRLHNQKPDLLMGQKPRSSAKSNRSKRSRASSRGIVDVEKKSQKLQESRLDINENENAQQEIPTIPNTESLNMAGQKTSTEIQFNKNPQDDIHSDQQEQQEPEQTKDIVFDQPDNPYHLPSFRLSNERPIAKKSPIDSILSNPYIKKAFAHLCKQSYIGGGKTFDQIAHSADIMTLNKWMVFCKQFDFVSKLKKKQLVDIFQQSTLNKPHMSQKQFLDALIIVQSKLKVDEEDFIRQHICLDSEFAFRQKVATFKVNYTGAKTNFFEQSEIKPIDKYYQNLRQQKYQTERKKQKQFILHQGKFQEDIEREILQRKNQRYLKKSSIINSSLTQNNQDSNNSQIHKRNEVRVNSPYLKFIQNKSVLKDNYSSVKNNYQLGLSKLNISRRIEPLTYSQLFTQKHLLSTQSFANDRSAGQIDQRSGLKNVTALKNTKNMNPVSQRKNTQSNTSKVKEVQKGKEKSSGQTTTKKPEKAQQKAQRQWVQQIKNWAEQFDKSQSEESDEILRQHLMNEKLKKKNLPQKMDLSRIAEEFRKDEKWLQDEDLDNASEWQRQTQLQATNKKERFK